MGSVHDFPGLSRVDPKADFLTGCSWKFLWHGDGSDKHGRFTVNGFRCEQYPRIEATRKSWMRAGAPSSIVTYYLDHESVGSRINVIAAYQANPEPPNQEGKDGQDSR